MSWAFKSQALMFPIRAQMEQAGNQAMMQGGLQHGQNAQQASAMHLQHGQNAQQAMHEMSAMHLKQQAFDQQVIREAQLQATRDASLNLQAKDLAVRSQALQHDREQKLFDREFAERQERSKHWGRRWGDDKGGWFLFGPTSEAMRYNTEKERDKAWEGFFHDQHQSERKVDISMERAAEYENRGRLMEERDKQKAKRDDVRNELADLRHKETGRHNLEMEGVAKKRARLYEEWLGAGGSAGEFDRMYNDMRTANLRSQAIERFSKIAQESLESLNSEMLVEGYSIDDPNATYRYGGNKGQPVYSKEHRETYKRKKKEIEDRLDLEVGRLSRRK